jgi:small subunit ribosomal protein S2
MAIPAIPDVKTLMEAGVHFGHASGRWHPKMKPYIFATRDKLHIIDLEKTREKLTETLTLLEQYVRSGKVIVLVGSKKQISERVKLIGETLKVPYVDVRWPGGIMTNFAEMQKSITRMKRTEEFLASGDASKMIKKERVMLESELNRMHHKFGGLRDLTKKPDALFVIDPSYEKNAIKEARHEGLKIFGIVDTNCNPTDTDHFIPANDDGPKSMSLLLDLIEETIRNGQKVISVGAEEKPAVTEDISVKAPEGEAAAEDREEAVANEELGAAKKNVSTKE